MSNRDELTPRRFTILLLLTWGLLCLGCPQPERPAATSAAPSSAAPLMPLRLLIIDDPQLATSVEREWHARSETRLEIAQLTENAARAALEQSESWHADAVIYPVSMMSTLITNELVSEVPAYVSRGDFAGDDFAIDDLFSVVRKPGTMWGETSYAIPFGQPVLVLGYRVDVLEQLGDDPPATWDELSQLILRIAKYEFANDFLYRPEYVLAQPLNPQWAAEMLLARAVPAAKNRARFSTLFDLRSMNAMIETPPFIEALDTMIADQQLGGELATSWAPCDAMTALRQGKCALAIGWPCSDNSLKNTPPGLDLRMTVLPGSRRVYGSSSGEWSDGDDQPIQYVTYLPAAGRLGSVVKHSRRQRAAWGLLVRLSGREFGMTVCSASRSTAVFRHSQVDTATRWVGAPWSSAAVSSYAEAVKQSLTTPIAVTSPRVIGAYEYRTALEQAVQRCLAGEATATEALQDVSATWNAMTDSIGRDLQSDAYHRNLGLQP